MFSQVFRSKLLLLLLLLCLGAVVLASTGPGNHTCRPTSCGNINISSPFRLKGDPCQNSSYLEIACEGNRPALSFNSRKYHVEAIYYHNSSIRLVDPGIQMNNLSSLPLYSIGYNEFSPSDYCIVRSTTEPLAFVSCPYAANPSLFAPSPACTHGYGVYSPPPPPSNYSSSSRQCFVKAGYMDSEELGVSCSIDLMTFMASFALLEGESYPPTWVQIHNALAFGFFLSWDQNACYIYYRWATICWFRLWFICIWSKCFPVPIPVPCGLYRILRYIYGYRWGIKGNLIISWVYLVIANIITINLALRLLFGIPSFVVLFNIKWRRRHCSVFDNIEDYLQSHNNLTPIRYSFSEIKNMTNGFKEKLGEGGYGCVYKGKLRSGNFVAIKMLGKSKSNGQEFISEVGTIGRIHHVNIVQLVGYCAERSKRALVYDFMPHGSLEKYVISREGCVPLSWERKLEIALGVARGIEYLHRGCDMQILHFDIKPHNILLDENFNPRVSDFGLARLYPTNKSIVPLTAARGTIGYVAPELINRNIGSISCKADVYSFGMLLLDLVGLKKNLRGNDDNSTKYFPDWIYDRLDKGKEIEMVEGEATGNERKITRKITLVALWCIQTCPVSRPSMTRVMKMLENDVELLQTPSEPFKFPNQYTIVQDQTDILEYVTESSALLEGSSHSQILELV